MMFGKKWTLAGLLAAGVGCAAPPSSSEDRMFLGHAPDSISARRIRAWKATQAQIEAAAIPTASTLSFPSREEWKRISGRGPASLPEKKEK